MQSGLANFLFIKKDVWRNGTYIRDFMEGKNHFVKISYNAILLSPFAFLIY